MIKEIPLPFNARYLGSDPFVILNYLCKRGFAIDTNQRVQMIGHKHQQNQIPSRALMVNALCSLAPQRFHGGKVDLIPVGDSNVMK